MLAKEMLAEELIGLESLRTGTASKRCHLNKYQR
jgi:hypothetical protein